MNPELMRVLSKSQENCLKLWNSPTEPPLQNKQFLSLVAQYQREGKPSLTKSQLNLYETLAIWRETIAKQEEVLPGMVCSLDYLARIAFHRPSRDGLQRINYVIPRILVKYESELVSFVKDSLSEDNIVIKDDTYPNFEHYLLAKTKSKEPTSLQLLLEKQRTILSNPMIWAVSCVAASLLLYAFHSDRNRRR